jgi:hypothetical protein
MCEVARLRCSLQQRCARPGLPTGGTRGFFFGGGRGETLPGTDNKTKSVGCELVELAKAKGLTAAAPCRLGLLAGEDSGMEFKSFKELRRQKCSKSDCGDRSLSVLC